MEQSIPDNDDEITLAAFQRWLRSARPGQSFVYHRGLLSADREQVSILPSGQYAHVYYEPMHSIGTEAWVAYERGIVTLAQRRLPGNRGFEYIAFKRKQAKRR